MLTSSWNRKFFSIHPNTFFFYETELNENETKDSEATGIDYSIHA